MKVLTWIPEISTEHKTCIQVVVRNHPRRKVYVRLCPYTIEHPTPAQERVRRTMALSSIKLYNEAGPEGASRETYTEATQQAFDNWVKSPKAKNYLHSLLMKEYGEDFKDSLVALEEM